MLSHLEPPNDSIRDWQLGFSGGTILLAGADNEPPLIFNRIAIGMRFDTERKRVLLTQADISNGEIGIAGTGSIDYSGEARLQLGFAGTPMSASALKRMWPILIVPEVREWVIERIERGTLQRIEVGVNSPVRNLSRKGPPIPDDGLAINIVASGVTVGSKSMTPRWARRRTPARKRSCCVGAASWCKISRSGRCPSRMWSSCHSPASTVKWLSPVSTTPGSSCQWRL